MTEKIESTRAVGECFAAHRLLWEAAADVARRLKTTTDEGQLMQMGATCMRMAAEQALQARNGYQALRNWRECILADRQIKLAIYIGLRRGVVDNGMYDDLFRLCRTVERIREEERQRLRRELCRNTIV